MTDRDRDAQDRLSHDNDVPFSGQRRENPGLLVVSDSKVNRIVISKTALLAGFRAFESEPGGAIDALDRHRPEAVLIDCRCDNSVCGPLLERIGALRNGSGWPRILVISRDGKTCDHLAAADIDSLMNSPITTDRLGTALHKLVAE